MQDTGFQIPDTRCQMMDTRCRIMVCVYVELPED